MRCVFLHLFFEMEISSFLFARLARQKIGRNAMGTKEIIKMRKTRWHPKGKFMMRIIFYCRDASMDLTFMGFLGI